MSRTLLPILAPLLLCLTTAAAADVAIESKSRDLLDRWRPRFQEEGLRYTVAGPFVIAGDGTQAQITRYRDGTVLAAARALRATYFDKEPAEPVLVLLFESREPYARLAKQWF